MYLLSYVALTYQLPTPRTLSLVALIFSPGLLSLSLPHPLSLTHLLSLSLTNALSHSLCHKHTHSLLIFFVSLFSICHCNLFFSNNKRLIFHFKCRFRRIFDLTSSKFDKFNILKKYFCPCIKKCDKHLILDFGN